MILVSDMKRDELAKTYFRISDVAELLAVSQSTLRFWESQFSFVAPKRNSHGTRYYSQRDLELLRMVKFLLKDRGLKIEAARAEILRNRQGVEQRFRVIERLRGVKDRLEGILTALDELDRSRPKPPKTTV